MQLNRSFSRRIGKSLSASQKELLAMSLPRYLFSAEKIQKFYPTDIFLEVGFGMGEHFVRQAHLRPDSLFIGAEVYQNGVANVLKLAAEQQLQNFLLWPDDLDLILEDLPDNALSGVYILFPDPWPKRKQHKKRIFNGGRLKLFSEKLKPEGFITFSSDIEDYFNESLALVKMNNELKISLLTEHNSYIPTKYHQKAIKEGRTPRFFSAQKCSV